MSRFFIGTAGWSYKDWEGIVYPLEKGASFHPLIFLSRYINFIEINSTFYRPPALRMSLSWVKRIDTHPEFLFSIKLHQVFTHQRKDFTQKDADNFKFGIEPLRTKQRLGAILIQFPWSFAGTEANRDYLVKIFSLFSGYPLALEVRHLSWQNPRFFAFLSEHNVCFCNIDQPLIGQSIKPTAVVTHKDFSYVRLHGRNYKNWFRKDAGRDERYDYLYTKQELDEWVERIKELEKNSQKVYIVTNNHYRGQAMANALQLKNMITGEKLNIPGSLLQKYPVLEEIVRQSAEGQLDLFKKKTG